MKNGLYVVHCEDSGGCLVVCLSTGVMRGCVCVMRGCME